MRRNPFGLQGLILVVVCLICVRAALAQAPPSSIQLFMPNGSAPQRAIHFMIVTDRGQTDNAYTDSNGVYLMRTPTTMTIFYTVTIEGDRETFDTTTTTFKLDRNSPARIVVFLKALPAIKRPAKEDAILDIATYESNIPSKARAAYKRALDSINDNHLESAISDLQQAINLYPTYVAALNDLGVTYMKLRRFEESEAAFRKAIEIDKRFFHPRMNLGIVLNKQGKYKEALEILEALYAENHGMLELRLAYGQALGGAGEFSEAEKIYRSTLSSKNIPPSTQANLHFRLGVLLNRQGRFADASSELEKAIAIDPDGANSHVQLGAALMQLQQADRAERELLRGYELAGSKVGIAQLLLGQIYYAEGKFAAAQKAFEQYLSDVPAAPNAPQISQLIAQLKTASKED